MKRTEAFVISPGTLQVYPRADELNDIGGFFYLADLGHAFILYRIKVDL